MAIRAVAINRSNPPLIRAVSSEGSLDLQASPGGHRFSNEVFEITGPPK